MCVLNYYYYRQVIERILFSGPTQLNLPTFALAQLGNLSLALSFLRPYVRFDVHQVREWQVRCSA